MPRLILLCGFLQLAAVAFGQYSPYYFYDTLRDDGITTNEHVAHLGTVQMEVYPEYKKLPDRSDSIPGSICDATVTAHLYLKRSLRYYYNQYTFDTTQNMNDWDYTRIRADIKIPEYMVPPTINGFFVCVLTCDNDTVAAWKTVAWNSDFRSRTDLRFRVWYDNYFTMADKENYYPLFKYIRQKKLSGTHLIKLTVYAGKLSCNSLADRGPEVLLSGAFRLQITDADLAEMLKVKDESKKFSFALVNFENHWRNY